MSGCCVVGGCWNPTSHGAAVMEVVVVAGVGIVVVVVRSGGRCCSCGRRGGCHAFVVGAVSAGIPAELVPVGGRSRWRCMTS